MRKLSALMGACLLVLAACGGDAAEDTTVPDDTTAATEPADTTLAAPDTTAAADTTMAADTTAASDTTGASDMTTMADGQTVAVAESDEGTILVDGEGFSLYLFTQDTQGEPSTCTEGCAETWPPLTGDVTAGDGVDASLLGTAQHPNGETQVTYDGWPLYYYAPDEAPGDTNGQGVGGVWFLVAPDGSQIGG
ncbi:MAG TPA: hypothetical protein VHL52_03195 [Acidimicrobiia bacterium]|nr:hypothetical protein [Acidimicrobiia bacterium]